MYCMGFFVGVSAATGEVLSGTLGGLSWGGAPGSSISLPPRLRRVAAPLLILFSLTFWSASAAAAPGEELNNGEDLTRPETRFDLRYQFQNKAGGVTQQTILLRQDMQFHLGDEWKIATRFDVPLTFNDGTGRDNPLGEERFGVGDVFGQVAAIETLTPRFAWAGGFRLVFPTATEDQFGSGKYRLLPIAGFRCKLPEISRGSFFQFIARYDFDLGGYGGRSHVSQLQFGPNLNLALPDRWYVSLFPSQDIVLNSIGGHKWFVPADFSVGRNLTERTVASVEVSVPLIKQFTLYDFKLEARLSVSF
jgi:hypothetical protein